MSVRVSLIVLAAVSAAACASTPDRNASNEPEIPQDCRSANAGMVVPRFMPRAMRATARVVDARAARLADAYLRVEGALREAGTEPNELPEQGLSWVGIVDGDALLAGVYRKSDSAVVREGLFGNESHMVIADRLEAAEQALIHTPTDCTGSFGLLDAGIAGDDGARLLYALRLVDRSKELTWGMHYRFIVHDGELSGAERLHVQCVTAPNYITDRMIETTPPQLLKRIRAGTARVGTSDVMPGHDLPTEAQMLQLRLNPEMPFSVRFWMREGFVDIERGARRIPDKYARKPNPCVVAEPD